MSFSKKQLNTLLQNIVVFKEVAHNGSFSKTADVLALTPSAVSKKISQLESELQVKLFERSTRSLKLTQIGNQLLQQSHAMLNIANQSLEMITDSKESMQGSINLAVPKAFAHAVLQPYLLEFMQCYPKVTIRLTVTDEQIDLLREDLDCAITLTQKPNEHVIAKRLLPIKQVVCASPSYLQAKKAIKQPMDLIQHNCITLGECVSDATWVFYKDGNEMAVPVNGNYSANHTGIRLMAVENHMGIANMPDFVAKSAIESGKITVLLSEWEMQASYQGFAWLVYLPNKYMSRTLKVFTEFLVQAFQK